MFEIGRVCVKTAGRDSNRKCVIVDIINKNYVLIEGETRRKKCNIAHLEPLDRALKINKNASREEVIEEMKKAGIKIKERKILKRKAKTKND